MRSRIAVVAIAVLSLIACSDAKTPASQGAVQSLGASPGSPPRIDSIVPAEARAGIAFNRQPDGTAAISVVGGGFVRGSVVTANRLELETAFGNEGWVTAIVPAELYARSGRIAIVVLNPEGPVSNAKFLEVKP
jgi:hypothetical protein